MKHSYITLYLVLLPLLFICLTGTSQTKIELLNYNSSECVEGVYYPNLNKFQNRILEIEKTDDFHLYNIFVVANCSKTQKGEIELKKDTLNLVFRGTREYRVYKETKNDSIEIVTEEWIEEVADCDCAFNLTYKIKGLINKDYIITLNNKIIPKTKHRFKIRKDKPSFKIVNNDTINYIDIYGLKQGLHIHNRTDGKQYSRIEYVDDEKVSGLTNTHYNFNGFDKVETFMKNKKYTFRKYYKNSKLIKTCDTDGSFDEGTNCKYEMGFEKLKTN